MLDAVAESRLPSDRVFVRIGIHVARRLSLLTTLLLGGLACLAATATAGTLGYRSIILADNPLVYFELDETSGTTAFNSAASGSSHDGVIVASAGQLSLNQASFTGGGTSYDFNNGFIRVPPLANSLAEWSISSWVNYDGAKLSASNFLSNDQDGWNNDVILGIGPEEGTEVPAGSVGVVHQGSPGSIRDFAGAPLAAGQWYHIAATGSTSSGTLSIFIDGVLAASDTALINGVTFNGADGFGTATLTIGASRTNGFRPYSGLLDELAIFDYVLTPAQITAHATGVPVPEPAGILLLPGRRRAATRLADQKAKRCQPPKIGKMETYPDLVAGTFSFMNPGLPPPTDVTLTPITEPDCVVLCELADTIWRQHYAGIISAAQIDYMLAGRFSDAALREHVQAADRWLELLRVSGTPVGYCGYELASMDGDGNEASPAAMKLGQLYVLESHRGMGLGKFMLGHVEGRARELGRRALWLQVNKQNTGAIEFYRAAGFEVVRKAVFEIGGGFVMDDFVMAKQV